MIDLDVARSLPEAVLRRHEAVPVLRVSNEMTVLLADPTNRQAAIELEALTGSRVTVALASREAVLHFLDRAFPESKREAGQPIPGTNGNGHGSPVVDLTGVSQVFTLLLGAVRDRASELHLEPAPNGVLVRLRVDGRLLDRAWFDRELLAPITFRLRLLAGLRSEPAPRLSRIRTRLDGRDTELEFFFLPTLLGEAISVRFQLVDREPPTLEALNVPEPVHRLSRGARSETARRPAAWAGSSSWPAPTRGPAPRCSTPSPAPPRRPGGGCSPSSATSRSWCPGSSRSSCPSTSEPMPATVLSQPADVIRSRTSPRRRWLPPPWPRPSRGRWCWPVSRSARRAARSRTWRRVDLRGPLLALTRGVVGVQRHAESLVIEAVYPYPGPPPGPDRAKRPMDVAELLILTKDRGGSDLHLSAGALPLMRLHGQLTPIEDRALSRDEVHKMVYEILNDDQRRLFEEQRDLDFAIEIGEHARFRVNVFNQRNGEGAVFRVIPTQIRSFQELGLPEVMQTLALRENGLVLVTGPTGSGKSTTLAAMIDLVNATQKKHIITLEDPIEFVHRSKGCFVNQREVGSAHEVVRARRCGRRSARTPTSSWSARCATSRRSASPLTAAETGHLVFGTLHTKSAPKTIDRIIDAFPPAQQQQVRVQLAEALQGVVSQLLLPTKDKKGRVAAFEIMVATVAIRNLIREGKTHQMPSSIQTGHAARHAEPRAGSPEPRHAGSDRSGPRRGRAAVDLVGLDAGPGPRGRARGSRAVGAHDDLRLGADDAVSSGASDVYFLEGVAPAIKVDGVVSPFRARTRSTRTRCGPSSSAYCRCESEPSSPSAARRTCRTCTRSSVASASTATARWASRARCFAA